MDETFGKAGMNISSLKTEHMQQGGQQLHSMTLRGTELRTVSQFTYLGVVQSKDAGSSKAI